MKPTLQDEAKMYNQVYKEVFAKDQDYIPFGEYLKWAVTNETNDPKITHARFEFCDPKKFEWFKWRPKK